MYLTRQYSLRNTIRTQPRMAKVKIFLNFVGPGSILWCHWLPLFWTLCDPPHGFQSQGGSLICTLTCLHVMNLRVTSGATPAFSTNRGVHCVSLCTAGPTFWTSLMQAAEGRQWWMLTFGSSEIQSRAAGSTSEVKCPVADVSIQRWHHRFTTCARQRRSMHDRNVNSMSILLMDQTLLFKSHHSHIKAHFSTLNTVQPG